MKIEMVTISQIKSNIAEINRNIAEINRVYNEKFELVRMNFEMIGSDIRLFLDNGNYEVNVFIGSLYEANKFLSFHRYCISALEHLF